MLPQRPPTAPPGARKSGPIAHPQMSFESVKKRVLAKLEDRLDMSASKRMPPSLLRQSLRQHADQITELEARAFSKADRDRLVNDVLTELLGYGPLEELFADPVVRAVMVTGPNAIIAKREQGEWLPTNVKFRDEAHVRATLDRMAAHADCVGPILATMSAFDVKLPNGFRAVAVIPPEALGQPATAVFVRDCPLPAVLAPKDEAPAPGSSSVIARPADHVRVSPRAPGSGLVGTPPPRTSPVDPLGHTQPDPLAKYRTRILERFLAKLASLKVYDLSRLDPNELQKIISAYVSEYAQVEKIYLSDTDQGRLTLEILTTVRK